MANSKKDNDKKENARIEYCKTQDAYIHYDSFTWQVGAVLIAGVFIYWGFIFSSNIDLTIILLGNFLICLLMTCWLLYSAHNRQLYLYKLHRIHELEEILGMSQHLRFKNKLYRLDPPKGHNINIAIYFITSIGGLAAILKYNIFADSNFSFLHIIIIVLNLMIIGFAIFYFYYVNDKTVEKISMIGEKNKEDKNK